MTKVSSQVTQGEPKVSFSSSDHPKAVAFAMRLYEYIRRAIFFFRIQDPVYVFSRLFVDSFRGENDGDMMTNGEADFLKRNARRFETVFDVGANVGDWTVVALQHLKSQALVHCFEPWDFVFRKLQKRNLGPRVFLNNFALGASPGRAPLYSSHGFLGGSSMYRQDDFSRDNSAASAQEVAVVSIDEYCREKKIDRIGLVKIDTEGDELKVIKGADTMLKRGKIDVVQFEYNYTWIRARKFLRDIFDIIGGEEEGKYPYDIYKAYPTKTVKIDGYRTTMDNFKFATYFLVRKGYGID